MFIALNLSFVNTTPTGSNILFLFVFL